MTLDVGSRPVEPPAPARTGAGRPDEPTALARERLVRRVLVVVVLLVVLTQRFVVPLGESSLGVPLLVAYGALAFLALHAAVRLDPVRALLFAAAVAACAGASWASAHLGGEPALSSFLLLLLMWAPWVVTLRHGLLHLYRPIGTFFVRLMLVLSAVGVLQVGAQVFGLWTHVDPFREYLPPQVVDQSYNASNLLAWDSPIIKAQAFVFLEPSFLSQFCALAVLLALLLRLPAWQPVLLVLGIAASLSGTGVILLVAGGLVLVLRVPRAVRPSYVVAGGLAVAAVLLSPAGAIFLDRADETSEQGTSGYLRFVQPYTETVAGMEEERQRYLVGAGAGQVDRVLESDRGRAGVPVVYTIAPKLLFEYGVAAGTAFCVFLLVALFRGPPLPVMPFAVLVLLGVLSGSLLQAHTVVLGWLLTSLWAAEGEQL